jgi:hypothetical protein
MQPLIRLALLAVILIACVALVAVHGFRGLVLIAVIAALATLPRTRVWRAIEAALVRLTGSRRGALAVVLGVLIVSAAAVNIYEYVR